MLVSLGGCWVSSGFVDVPSLLFPVFFPPVADPVGFVAPPPTLLLQEVVKRTMQKSILMLYNNFFIRDDLMVLYN